MRLRWRLGTTTALALAAIAPAAAEERTAVRGADLLGDAVVGRPIEVDLRFLPVVPAWQPGDPIREVPRRDDGSGRPVNVPPRPDPLLEAQSRVPLRTSGVGELHNFQATASTANPNDPTGDVGISHFVEAINAVGGTSVTIYDKLTEAVAAGPFSLDSLSASAPCNNGHGDPVVLFDPLAGRWFLSEFSITGNALCVYTSRTADPITGGWCAYVFTDTGFPDYPKYGVWPELYMASANQGDVPPVYAFDRVNMLSPDGASCPTARPVQKVTGPGLPALGFEAFTPVDLDGTDVTPGLPAYFLRHRDEELNGDAGASPSVDRIELWALDVDFDTPANTTFSKLPDVTVADFDSNLCPPISVFSCIPQPGGGFALDPLLEVVMNRASYRKIGARESIVGVLQIDVGDVDDHSGERWFEIRRRSGTWSLHQEGTYSPDAEGRFMGTIAMDKEGNILLAYNVSSTTVFPSIRYTGRHRNDAEGAMTLAETTLAAGAAVNSSSRYGDYNQMGVDPEDDCTFWFLGMYNPAGKSVGVGAVRFDSCPSYLFSDDFESGDASAWSGVAP